jgi:tight adherence protein C
MTLFLAVLGVFAFVVVTTNAVATELNRRRANRASLRLLASYGDNPEAGVNRLDPFVARTIAPAIASVSRIGYQISPAGSLARVSRKLRIAGYVRPGALDRFLAARFGLLVLAVPSALLLRSLISLRGLWAVLLVVSVIAAAVLGPDVYVSRKAEARQLAIRTSLPEFLDLLTVSVEAGIGFDQALERVTSKMTGPLAEQFQRVRGETLAGASREDALRSMAERVDLPELRSFVLAMQQAAEFGIPIGDVLRSQSEDMRIRWRQIAQERAIKSPVKMLVPTVLCVFPSLFVVTVGPAFVRIVNGGL